MNSKLNENKESKLQEEFFEYSISDKVKNVPIIKKSIHNEN